MLKFGYFDRASRSPNPRSIKFGTLSLYSTVQQYERTPRTPTACASRTGHTCIHEHPFVFTRNGLTELRHEHDKFDDACIRRAVADDYDRDLRHASCRPRPCRTEPERSRSLRSVTSSVIACDTSIPSCLSLRPASTVPPAGPKSRISSLLVRFVVFRFARQHIL